MTTITIDGLNEEEFRRSIERKLRNGQAVDAVERLRELLASYAGPDNILPERFLSVSSRDLTLNGWDSLADSLRRHDRPGRPVTALSIALAWPGDEVPQPDSEGRLNPHVEVGYYTDDAYPFSKSGRDDLLDGYSYHGCTWSDDCEATDRALWLGGVDDLHGALAGLEAKLLASEEPDPEEISAGSLGACLLSVLLHQAVGERIERDGLPRPLCVMAGSNGVYPYFDAPVVGLPEHARRAEDEDDAAFDAGVPAPRYSSLLVTGIRRAQKRAVLVLEETEEESAVRIARLRGQNHGDGAPVEEPPVPVESDTLITATPASPLMVKKPSGQNWDFREMLGPRDPGTPQFDAGSEESEWDESESGWNDAGSDWDEPAPQPASIEPATEWNEPAVHGDDPLSEGVPEELATGWDEPSPASIGPEPEPEPVPAPEQVEAGWLDSESLDSPAEPALPTPEIVLHSPDPIAEEPLELTAGEIEPALVEMAEITAPSVPAQEPYETLDLGDWPEPELAAPAQEPCPQPGFSLFDPQERLQSLLALHLPVRDETPEPAELETSEPLAPVWARGLAWREKAAPAPSPPAWLSQPAASPLSREPAAERSGLWARIRGWWLGQR